jgi:hypothetical protein
MGLGRFFHVVFRIGLVGVRHMRMMAGLLMIPGLVMICRLLMVLCGMFVMFSSVTMMVSRGFCMRHDFAPWSLRGGGPAPGYPIFLM